MHYDDIECWFINEMWVIKFSHAWNRSYVTKVSIMCIYWYSFNYRRNKSEYFVSLSLRPLVCEMRTKFIFLRANTEVDIDKRVGGESDQLSARNVRVFLFSFTHYSLYACWIFGTVDNRQWFEYLTFYDDQKCQ